MTVIADVFKELFSMFVGDARLTIAILLMVALVAAILKFLPQINPVLAGFALLAGCLGIIATTTALHARQVNRKARP